MTPRNRVVGIKSFKAKDIRRNPKNWRLHPESQKAAMRAVFDEIGIIDLPIVRMKDGEPWLIDGHLRTDIMDPDADVQCLVVDLDDAEADMALATFDPLSGMAETDNASLKALMASLDATGDLRSILDTIGADYGVKPPAFVAVDEDTQPRLDQVKSKMCPECGYEFE